MTAPLVTLSPASAVSPVTVPSLCAVIGCSIFIASSTTMASPAATRSPSRTATLTMVPCMGEVTASPLTPAPDRLSRIGLRAAAGWAAPVAARPAGSRTSRRRPPTSTVTARRSSGSGASGVAPA
jgi:hypothetical protein